MNEQLLDSCNYQNCIDTGHNASPTQKKAQQMSQQISVTAMEKCIYGKNVEILTREEDATVYRLTSDCGEILMTSYHVFPGIELIYNDVHAQYCDESMTQSGNIIEINHCLEGRIEVGYENEYFYLEAGDLAIASRKHPSHESFFPTNHYHGITIRIDADYAPECLSCFLDDVNVNPMELIKKYCAESECFLMRTDKSIEHIFSELYSVRDSIRRGYFKIKVLELLLFLSGMDTSQTKNEQHLYTQSQVELAKRACRFIMAHLNDKMKIDDLSEMFHVSPTQLKNCFKGVYGMSVYSYIRTQKIQSASLLLKNSDLTVLDIAGRFGYNNGSKFAKAFRDVIGMTPNEYRNTL